MTSAQRREARVALAMLPVGILVFVASTLALIAVAADAIAGLTRGGWSWALLLWWLVATAVALWNMRAGIAMTSAFDWRPLPSTLLLSIVIVAVWPGWWP